MPVQTSPLAIGRVATLEGGATAFRNGVQVSLNVGDVIVKGDVIQTSSDSECGVIFSDGTTFSMSANARMVLNEFVYKPGRLGQFVAGQSGARLDLIRRR